MKLGLVITGGGSLIISDMLTGGGASSYFSFAEIPYSVESSNLILKRPPEKYGSIETANKLAEYCLDKLKQLHPNQYLVAVGCSAVLAKANQRPDRENAAFITKLEFENNRLSTTNLALTINNTVSRFSQEYLVADILDCLIFNKPTEDYNSNQYNIVVTKEVAC